MVKITRLNKEWFEKSKKVVLVTGLILGVIVSGSILIHNNNHKEYYDPYAMHVDPTETICNYYYDNKDIYNGDDISITTFTYHPSNIYKLRVFLGKNTSTHYRIEIGEDCIEHTKWMEIPEDGLITINRNGFSNNQYEKEFFIRFGSYDSKLDKIVYDYEHNNKFVKSIFSSDCSLEEIQKVNLIKEKMCENIKKLIDENDSDFDKIKKVYDYVINNFDYSFDLGDEYLNYSFKNFKKIYKIDCTGYAEFIDFLLNSIGIESFSVDDSVNGHIWNIVRLDNKYYHLDATYSDIGSWNNTSKYRYFLVSDKFMREEYRYFVAEKDVKCDTMYDLSGIVDMNDINYRGYK